MVEDKFIVSNQVLKEYFNVNNIIDIIPFGSGHINSTFVVVFPTCRYLLQKINDDVFASPFAVMHNIELVTEYIKKNVIYDGKDPRVSVLTIVLNKHGQNLTMVEDDYWRCMRFIEEGITYDQTEDLEIFREVGRAIGEFQRYLNDFRTRLLADTIKHFHDTPYRYGTFLDIIKIDRIDRVKMCQPEIEFVKKYENRLGVITSLLEEKKIPRRVTHNDTKLNNIMISKSTGKALGLIDLDTVMKGSLLYDYGDALRLGASTASEDETDLSKVNINFDLFEAFTDGYLKEVKSIITDEEIKHLLDGYFIMTFEVGMRFLTDFIDGDKYFTLSDNLKETRPLINLERAKNQLKLAKEIDDNYEKLTQIINKILKNLDYNIIIE